MPRKKGDILLFAPAEGAPLGRLAGSLPAYGGLARLRRALAKFTRPWRDGLSGSDFPGARQRRGLRVRLRRAARQALRSRPVGTQGRKPVERLTVASPAEQLSRVARRVSIGRRSLGEVGCVRQGFLFCPCEALLSLVFLGDLGALVVKGLPFLQTSDFLLGTPVSCPRCAFHRLLQSVYPKKPVFQPLTARKMPLSAI